MNNASIGNRIAARRTYLKWSQEYLASRINVERSTLAKWETGDRGPSALDLLELCKAFEVSAAYFQDDIHEAASSQFRDQIRVAAYDDNITEEDAEEIAEYIRFKREQKARKRGAE